MMEPRGSAVYGVVVVMVVCRRGMVVMCTSCMVYGVMVVWGMVCGVV